MSEITFRDDLVTWLWMGLGVVIAVLLPVMTAYVKNRFRPTARVIDTGKYFVLVAFAAVTAVVVLAVYRLGEPDTELTWFVALLAGYGWEATIEKLALS